MPYRIGRRAYLDKLDEDLSTVDGSEAEIYSKFNDIASDKPLFPSATACPPGNTVIQQGTHVQLIADKSGKYHELLYAQAQYYDKE
ncbi:MAG: hypothetical protein ACI4L5_03820 [Negativibacillus sp.]